MTSKKHTQIIIALVASIVVSLAYARERDTEGRDLLLEVKGAMFIPTNKKFRKIYHSVLGSFGAECTGQLMADCDDWYGWLSADFLLSKGRSLCERDCTKLFLMPLGLGLKYLYTMKCWDWYAGAGVTATYLRTKDFSTSVCFKRSKWAPGGVFKLGGIRNIKESFFIDIFAQYSFVKLDFCDVCCDKEVFSHKVDASGTSLGIGLGYRY